MTVIRNFMSMRHSIKTILLVAVATLLHAEVETHPFDIESGMVIYEIKGGAQLTPETNLTIQGQAKLRFKDWGETKWEEESGLLLTSGAIKHKQHVKRLEKKTKEKVVTADFEQEQLIESKISSNDMNLDNETASLTRKGQEEVAGILCDVWEGEDVKKCIYKNILLKFESHILDVSYVKEATEVIFDMNTSSDGYEMPDYPVQKFALFKDDIKTKNSYEVENFCKVLKNISFDACEDNTSYAASWKDEEREKFINHIARDIFERQKELLPQLLQSLKETRACLQLEESPDKTNQCLENLRELKAQFGREEDTYMIMSDKKGQKILHDKIEDELIHLESRIPCVNRAKNITDLSECMK